MANRTNLGSTNVWIASPDNFDPEKHFRREEMIFSLNRLGVPKEGNFELTEIAEEHDALMERYELLQKELLNVKIPDDPGMDTESMLNDLQVRIEQLSNEMLDFENKTRTFIQAPSVEILSIGQPNKVEVVALNSHVRATVSMIRQDVHSSRLIMSGNHASLVSEAYTRLSLNKANESIWLSGISFLLGLISLFVAIAVANC